MISTQSYCGYVFCSTDLNECDRKTNDCDQHASCTNERGLYSCKCNHDHQGNGFNCAPVNKDSCSVIRKYFSSVSGNYKIDPDGAGGLAPFTVHCDMSDKNGVGVTVISHDSESRTRVKGTNNYLRDIHYTGASISQLAGLTRVSLHCEQFIKYECHNSVMRVGSYAWWVSRDSTKMTYWGGASPSSGKCACGMTSSCAGGYGCNCDKNDNVWREDSGLLTDKTHLPVKQLRFSDTTSSTEEGYHTLGKLKCYGIA